MASRYRLDSPLSQGGMGSVWLAHHLTLDSPVAIKLIDPAVAGEAEALERFMREAQAAAALRGPHVVQTLDYGVHGGVPYIAMELLEGESLAARLSRVRRLSPAETASVLTQVARAVARAHELGIVHRDLKPENVFLVRNDDEEIAKVLDFGIAKRTAASADVTAAQTRAGALLGTPYYMSPEQAEGAAIDHRSDLWAMGVIAFECMLGERPFQGTSIGEIVLKICSKPMPTPSARGPVPADFDAWFAKACARDLNQRFQSVRELLDAFRSLALSSNGELCETVVASPSALPRPPATTTSVPVFRPTEPPATRVRPVLWLGVAAAGVLVTGLAGALWHFGAGSTFAAVNATSSLEPIAAAPAARPAAMPVARPAANGPTIEPVAVDVVAPTASSAPAVPSVPKPAPRTPKPTALRAPRPIAATAPRPVAAIAPRPPAPQGPAVAPEPKAIDAPAPAAPPARPRPTPPRVDEPTDFGF